MRAIKFKGKCIDPKFDGKIACGSLLTSPDGTERIFEHDHDKVFNYFSVDPQTLCQFTGFFDKNGNEIYEGDTAVHFCAFVKPPNKAIPIAPFVVCATLVIPLPHYAVQEPLGGGDWQTHSLAANPW